MKQEINFDIGFSDGEILSYCREPEQLIVVVKMWNDKKIKIVFRGIVGCSDYGIGDISALVEEDRTTEFFKKILSEVYEKLPSQHPYHLYQFLNLDDSPCLEIVAETIEIS